MMVPAREKSTEIAQLSERIAKSDLKETYFWRRRMNGQCTEISYELGLEYKE